MPTPLVPNDRLPLSTSTITLGYADTDPAGILYYAAWFPCMERLQTRWFYEQGLRQDELAEKHGFWTVTCRTECDYLVPAKLFDEIRIELRLGRIGRRSFDMHHEFIRTDDHIAVGRAMVRLVTVMPNGESVEIPPLLRDHLDAWRQGHPLNAH